MERGGPTDGPFRDPSTPGGDLEGPRRPGAPTRRETLAGVRKELEDAGVESPRTEAERLVAHALGLERTRLLRALEERLSPREAGLLAAAVRRRLAGQPLQHIEGTVEFRELVLRADPRALIPRPETEQLVEAVLRWARTRGRGAVDGPEEPGRGAIVRPARGRGPAPRPWLRDALDIGTGSGAIALSLVVEGIVQRAVGIDVSAEALAQAAENRTLAGLSEDRVEFRLAARPAWSGVRAEERFDVIVSNPPYVSDEELEALPREVREHEPREALAGGREGLGVVREIVERAAHHLRPEGALFLEIGARQGRAVRELLEAGGEWRRVEVQRDLAGRDRFVRAEPAFN